MYTLQSPSDSSVCVARTPSSPHVYRLIYSKSKTFFLAIFHFSMMLIPFVFLMMHLGVERFKLHSYASIAINVFGVLTFFAFFVAMKVFLFNEDKNITSFLSVKIFLLSFGLDNSASNQEKKIFRLNFTSNLLCIFSVSLIAGLGIVQCAYTINNGIFSSNANTIILSTIASITFLLLLINLIIRVQISSIIFKLYKKYYDDITKVPERHCSQSMTEHELSLPESDEKSDDKKTIFDVKFVHQEYAFESDQKQDFAPETLIQDQELGFNTPNFGTEV